MVLGKLRPHWGGIPPYITKALVEAKRKLAGFYTLVSLVNFWWILVNFRWILVNFW